MANFSSATNAAEIQQLKAQMEGLAAVHGAGLAGVQEGLLEQKAETSELASVHGSAIAGLQADMIETKDRVTNLESA